jgi:hypothetical protein
MAPMESGGGRLLSHKFANCPVVSLQLCFVCLLIKDYFSLYLFRKHARQSKMHIIYPLDPLVRDDARSPVCVRRDPIFHSINLMHKILSLAATLREGEGGARGEYSTLYYTRTILPLQMHAQKGQKIMRRKWTRNVKVGRRQQRF